MEKIGAYSINSDEIRIYDTSTTDEFNERLISEMQQCRPQHSSKCRADFRGACDPQIERQMTSLFEQSLKTYVDELFEPEIYDNFDFYLDWSINVYRNGTAAISHTHNEAFLTLLYYPQSCEGLQQQSFTLSLFRVKTGDLVISNPSGLAIWDRYAKSDARFPLTYLPKQGQMLIMPGCLPHWTVPGERQTRYCLAAFVLLQQKTARPLDFKSIYGTD